MSNGSNQISIKLIVVLGSAIAAAFTLAQLAVNQLSHSSDRDADHYHELVTAIVKQMESQHADFLAESRANRAVTATLSDRIAERFPVVRRTTPHEPGHRAPAELKIESSQPIQETTP